MDCLVYDGVVVEQQHVQDGTGPYPMTANSGLQTQEREQFVSAALTDGVTVVTSVNICN